MCKIDSVIAFLEMNGMNGWQFRLNPVDVVCHVGRPMKRTTLAQRLAEVERAVVRLSELVDSVEVIVTLKQ